ncbi:MAG: class I SAM-dependent methyltransferase [Oscillospiraceae bacterium]|nr:class I SAM-dependent methyltransferase [Oscillospiraceae bacterium]
MDKNIQAWNDAARSYSAFEDTSCHSLFCRAFISKHFSDVDKLNVLDAGCGNGEYTHILSQNGGIVTGCDASAEMIKIAKEKYPLYNYEEVNIMGAMPYENNAFDIVFCHLVLMDIDPIDNAISEFYRITKNNGRLFFSIVHPAFYRAEWEKNEQDIVLSKKVFDYITPIAEQQMFWGATMHYHRPISYYLNTVAKAGFTLKEILEPKVYGDDKIPDIPLYLFVEFQKDK